MGDGRRPFKRLDLPGGSSYRGPKPRAGFLADRHFGAIRPV